MNAATGRKGVVAACEIRLTVLGHKKAMNRFHRSQWERWLKARNCTLLQDTSERFACLFETRTVPLTGLERLSRASPALVFLLDYELPKKRMKGLVVFRAGRSPSHQVTNY